MRIGRSEKHKGFGIYAARNIKQGELIMTEPPLLLFDNEAFNKSEPEFRALLQRDLEALPQCDRQEFLTLANAFTDDEERALTGIIYSNVFDLQNATGLFLKISRINHSCKPSVQADYDGGFMRLQAVSSLHQFFTAVKILTL